MKRALLITGAALICSALRLPAEELSRKESLAKHQQGASTVANEQDELSADVQQLAIEQTVPKVIALLDEVKSIMDEATDRLAKADTGGESLAAQTEIIEKIHDAAKEKQKQGGGKAGGAMMDMMERMMGKGDDGKQGKGKDGKPSDQGGQGVTGLSDTGNEASSGAAGGKNELRRVPKAAGSSTLEIPEEFRKAFDAYNRGVEKKIK